MTALRLFLGFLLISYPPIVSSQEFATPEQILLKRLDLAGKGLNAVKTAADARNWEKAATALLTYYRKRTLPRWFFDRKNHKTNLSQRFVEKAEKVLRREYRFVGKTATLEHDIDWNANPLNDPEWPIELNRHYTWVTLGRAYWQTGDETYANDFVFQILDWIEDNPRPENLVGARATWRTLEVGIRLAHSWPESFHRFLDSPAVTPRVLCAILNNLWEQGDYLTHFRAKGNSYISELSGLATLAIVFPEFKDSPDWRKTALEKLTIELNNQIYPDGAHKELSPHYHRATLENFLRTSRIAALNQVKLPDSFLKSLQKMYTYLVKIVKPDGRIPMINDSDHDDLHPVFRTGAKWFDDKAMLFLATDGKAGSPPEFTSAGLRWAGQYVMRSGWENNALYLVMDAGPFGTAHQHEDQLAIDIYGFGRSLIVDPGRYTYKKNEWRDYFKNTTSHSTLILDGVGQQRHQIPCFTWETKHALENLWISNDDIDFVTGSYLDGYGFNHNLIHVRKIFFAKADYWIVHDLLIGKRGYTGKHTATVQFQFAEPGAKYDEESLQISTSLPDANLLLIPTRRDALQIELFEGRENPPRGWVAWSLHDANKQAATLAALSRNAGVPINFDTILYPYYGAQQPTVEVKPISLRSNGEILDISQAFAVSIRGKQWTDIYMHTHTPLQSIEFGDYVTDAELVYIRWSPNNELIKIQRIGGSFLKLNDRLIDGETNLAKTPHPTRRDLRNNHISAFFNTPASFVVEYGYADGGGFIFSTPVTTNTRKAEISLPGLTFELDYLYRLVRFDEGQRVISREGKIRIDNPEPTQH